MKQHNEQSSCMRSIKKKQRKFKRHKKMRNRVISSIIILSTVFISSACTSTSYDEESSQKTDAYSFIEIGDTLPPFSVVMNDSSICSNTSLKGCVSAIIFFNTECKDCQKELPIINSIYNSYSKNYDLKFIAISRSETATEINSYWRVNGFSLPFSAQSDRSIYNKFASQNIPRIYISDKYNRVVAKFYDEDMPDSATIAASINKTLSY